MFKKTVLAAILLACLFLITKVSFNSYLNNPDSIASNLKSQISKTKHGELISSSDWLWKAGRSFVFDIIYMNIFSPGTATLSIVKEGDLNDHSVYFLEALLKPNKFFRDKYDANMKLSSAVLEDSKATIWYQETSTTPEKKKTKEIIFDRDLNIAEREGIKYQILKETHDPLSTFFALLDQEFILEKPITLTLLSKEEIYEFKVTPLSQKKSIYKLFGEVYRQDRSSTHGAKFTIWVKNGQVRVPLLIKVASAAGPVYLRLKSIK